MKTVYDLSQPIENGMTYYPGDPQPAIQPADQASAPWRVSQLSIGSHTGTHIDAAAHFFPSGRTIDRYPLERFLPQGIVIPISGLAENARIPPESLLPFLDRIQPGMAVLIRTGWDRFWKQELYLHHPYLSSETAQQLVTAGAGLVGIDALNVDSTQDETEYVHQIFLGNDILIVENLTKLEQLHAGQIYQMSFLPLFLSGVDGSPIRAAGWEVG
jgi:kynurenine formamidase